jgi:hypothetical protein
VLLDLGFEDLLCEISKPPGTSALASATNSALTTPSRAPMLPLAVAFNFFYWSPGFGLGPSPVSNQSMLTIKTIFHEE